MQIDKNIPIPEAKPFGGIGKWTPLFDSMDIGDSIRVDNDKIAASVQTSLAPRKKLYRVMIRRLEDRSYRCWKVAPK